MRFQAKPECKLLLVSYQSIVMSRNALDLNVGCFCKVVVIDNIPYICEEYGSISLTKYMLVRSKLINLVNAD